MVNKRETIKTYLTGKDIKESLANTPQVTFEVTDGCNLKCEYCGYGMFYDNYEKRENKNLSPERAIELLCYLAEYWNSTLNVSSQKNVYISFYGGEPLMNMSFIQKVVDFIENEIICPTRHFTFSMTTNAILLDKYMDYLAEHRFSLLISLDGNEENTSYRMDHSGKPAYQRIVKNVDKLREKYPVFFNEHVNFNSVLHNRNSVESIYYFFKEKYNKIPSIGELNNMGIREDRQEEFMRAYRNSYESLHQAEHYEEIERDMFTKSGSFMGLTTYLMQYSDFVYNNYNELLFGKEKMQYRIIPTGTCMPFSKKIFVTVNGKILTCERIGHQFALGEINDKGINIDAEKIAEKYNRYYAKLDRQCSSCYNKKACKQCIYNLPDIDEERVVCHGYMSKKQFEEYENSQLSYLSENPDFYQLIMTEVIVK